jgi:SNF2 family DNA or RNA helicase
MSAKLSRMEELVYEAVAEGGKVLVYSNWTTVTSEAVKRLMEYSPAVITGEVKAEGRHKEAKRFQEDPGCKVCVGTVSGMGTGITLTAANAVIFIDEPWTKAVKGQCEDRAHRIGTTGSVTIYTLITKDTVDERVHQIVVTKGAVSDYILGKDGEPTSIKLLAGMRNGELCDFLLS